MHSLLCVFISQYSNNVNFILMDLAKMGPKGGSPFGAAIDNL